MSKKKFTNLGDRVTPQKNQVDQVQDPKPETPGKKKRKQSELPTGTKRFTAYLNEADITRLKEVSEATRIPMSEILAKALSDYLKATWTDKKIQQAKDKLNDIL